MFSTTMFSKKGPKKRIVVMTVKYADYAPQTRACIIAAREALRSDFIFYGLSTPEVYIHAARRQLLQESFRLHGREPFDYFMFLDSDIRFKPQDIVRAVKHLDNRESDFIAGLYFNVRGNNHPMVCTGDIEKGFNWDFVFKLGKAYVADAVGLGFAFVTPQLVADYAKAYLPHEWFCSDKWYPLNAPIDQRVFVVGEDIDFCLKVRALGYQIVLDTRILVGKKNVTYQNYLNNRNKGMIPDGVQEEMFC